MMDNQANAPTKNDGLSYATEDNQPQAVDPLAEIKAMRLAQLAICRLKADTEMQVMQQKVPVSNNDKGIK